MDSYLAMLSEAFYYFFWKFCANLLTSDGVNALFDNFFPTFAILTLKIFSSKTTQPIKALLYKNVLGVSCIELLWGFLTFLKTDITINRQQLLPNISKTVTFSKILMEDESVQHDQIFLWWKFCANLLTSDGAFAIFWRFPIFAIFTLKIIFSETTQPITALFDNLACPAWNYCRDFWSIKKTWLLLKIFSSETT